MLSAHEIDDIVDRLRQWLVESNEQIENHDIEELAQLTRQSGSPGVGLLEVAEAFTALRQEIKLHTKSVRSLNERVEKGLDDLGQSNALLIEAKAEVKSRGEELSRQLINSLLDVDEALGQALATCSCGEEDQGRGNLLLLEQCQWEFQQLPLWRRTLLKSWHERMMRSIKNWQSKSATSNQDDYVSGLQILKAKLQRTLAENQVTPIDGIGQPVDPSQMRIVATVVDAQQEPGTVVEQLRPGYLRNSQVLRHAEVKVVAHK